MQLWGFIKWKELLKWLLLTQRVRLINLKADNSLIK
jgi:hypothetical protein